MVEARRRIPILLRLPARVHWLSVAPLLESASSCDPGLGAASIGSSSVARLARRMLATWNRNGRVTCVISAATQVPRSV